MNFAESLKKVKAQFTEREMEDQEYDNEETPERVDPAASVAARPAAVRSAARGVSSSTAQPYTLVVVNPENYKDAEKIGDNIKAGHPVVINVEKTDEAVARRLVDFVHGVMYALDGKMEKISDTIFLCAPHNTSVETESFSAYTAPAAASPVSAPAMDVPQWTIPRT